jgi:CubicO group peptidase (beta-lactamase class C family)
MSTRTAPSLGLLPILLVLASEAVAQAPVPLRVGQTVSGSIAPGDTIRYILATHPEYLVRATVDQISADVAIRILRPDGSQLRRVDARRRGLEPFQFETEREGAYRLEVVPVDDARGEFRIRLDRLEPVATDPEALAEQLLSLYDDPTSPGAGVRVWRDGETLYSRTWGMANLEHGVPFREDTPTNIGSTSKQFTAFAVMLLVERGLVSLDDDVRDHLPELPDFGQKVQVRHLLVHATGYREIYNLLIMAGRRIDMGDHLSRDEVVRVVQNQPVLQNDPGAEWNYNNTAYGLAALLVERVSGLDFDQFMREEVFAPLGMNRSAVRPHPQAVIPGRSAGYAVAPGGGFQELRDLGGAVGAGAIYASLEDLQRWAENYREPRVGSPATIEAMMMPFVTTAGDTTGYGLGLSIDEQRGLKRVHHGGADMAHRSMLAYYPEIGAGITVQSNFAGFNPNAVAFRLAEAFFRDAMEPEEDEEEPSTDAPFDPAAYDPADFDAFAGRYALDSNPSFVIRLFRDGSRLLTQATGQPEFEVTPTSDTTFALNDVPASFTVHRDESGRGEALTLHQGGIDQRATRLDDEAEEDAAWEPTAEQLGAFVGRYLSEELETFYTIVLEDDRLVLRHPRLDAAALSPGSRDNFSAGMNQLSFERDRHGRVIAFYMGNVRARDVRFERVR